MSTAEFLDFLAKHDVRLQAEGGQLRFHAKQGALTPELRAQIVDRKPELLAFLRQASSSQKTAPNHSAIPKTDRNLPLPLSFSQERLWFLDQLEGPSSTYNLCEAWELHGKLNQNALSSAVQEFVQRHETLRTTFVRPEGAHEAVQKIHAFIEVPLLRTDLTKFSGPDKNAEALRVANETARLPFNLSAGPLLRAHLIELAPNEHLLALTVHHIVFDGGSAEIAYRELESLYTSFCSGVAPTLQEPEIHYPDYAVWERKQLSGDGLNASLAFWQSYLKDAPNQLDLPTDFVRPTTQSYRGNQTSITLAPALVKQLRELARTEHATLYHATIAAWNILLHRYTGQTDLIVGTTVSNRQHAELESAIGFFVNTVPLRTHLDSKITARETLRRVQASTLSALSHHEIPFERLVQSLNPKRQLGNSPIFQVCLSFQTKSGTSRRFHDLTLKTRHLQLQTAKFDLSLWLTDNPEGLRVSLEYATDLFTGKTAERMLGHFSRIIEEMVAKPDATIDQLQITTEAEKRQLLTEWNDTACDYPRDRCLHQLFEEQAQRTPNAIALVFEDKSLTYAALNQRADQLAALLRSRGIGPDVLVGLCVERSLDMVVGVLGILKAGGAYVPIDPAYPADRIAYVLEDSNASVLITQRPLLASLPKTNASLILIDEPLPKPVATSISTAPLEPIHLAYVLYTSGSTGKPKGVQIPHRAVVNFLHSMQRKPGLTANDVLLAVTTLSFDIAGLELHLPLTSGAKIILATAATASNGDALLATIKRHDVTMLQATPATWRLMLASGWKGSPRLKALCGGEALPSDLAAELLPRCAELWNMYGPTETTIWSTCSRVESATDIHIGRPIDNTEIYILDPHQQPLPIGLPGELLIGGDGLARGYHNRADLTADRFVPHPFKTGAKLYRTGDLARYRPDGHIDCLGRLDHQVKIRGFRIELGEIETQLASHPDVQQNVVVAREDTPGDKRLVAYVVPRPATSPASTALRDHLRGNLPEYMLPAAFVFLASLPLTPNGKIDRKALPAPDSTAAPITKDAVAPRTPTETQLAAIFEKVLSAPVPSITDSFFDLGGHSLLATKLMADIETAFGQRLPLAKLFEAPSIEQLATILDSRSTAKTDWNSLVPINTGAKGPALYLVHGAGGNILLYRELARELMPDIKVFGFQSQGLDGQTSLLTTVDQMARHYTDELLRHQPQGPYFLGGYCMGGIVAYEMARLLRASGHSVGPVAMLDSYNLNAVHIERSFFSRLGSIRQKIFFHFENLRQMRFAEKCGYFREKIRMLIELIRLKVSPKIKLSSSNQNPTQTGKSSLATIQDINHRAGWDHVPGRYEGHLLLFKPRKNYDFFPDPDMGWKRLVTGQIDQIELTSHPHSMLIMPNVTKLAAELKARLPEKGD